MARGYCLRISTFSISLMFASFFCGCSLSQSSGTSRRAPNARKTEIQINKLSESPEREANSLQCVGENTCWVIGFNNVWRTTDRGRNWKLVGTLHNRSETLYFTDENNGWRYSANGLSKTTDGGISWEEVHTPLDAPTGLLVSGFFAQDGNSIWVGGALKRPWVKSEDKPAVPNDLIGPGGQFELTEAIFHSKDGGATWQRQLHQRDQGKISFISLKDNNFGIARSGRRVYYTRDGGAHWVVSAFDDSCIGREFFDDTNESSPQTVALYSPDLWWISYDDGRLMKSIDGGQTWCDLVRPNAINFGPTLRGEAYFHVLYFSSDRRGFGLGADKFLYETTDGGANWSRVASGVTIIDMYPLGAGNLILLSTDGLYTLSE